MNKQSSGVDLVARASTSRTRLLRGGFSYEELGPRPEGFTTSVFDPLVANRGGVPPFGQYGSFWSVFQWYSYVFVTFGHKYMRETSANSAIASVHLRISKLE